MGSARRIMNDASLHDKPGGKQGSSAGCRRTPKHLAIDGIAVDAEIEPPPIILAKLLVPFCPLNGADIVPAVEAGQIIDRCLIGFPVCRAWEPTQGAAEIDAKRNAWNGQRMTGGVP